MAQFGTMLSNLVVADRGRQVVGCGVWRGGMSAALAEALGARRDYLLFHSFAGMPPATAEDGKAAADWQSDVSSPTYYNNCRAPTDFAAGAMTRWGIRVISLSRDGFEGAVPRLNSWTNSDPSARR